MRLNEVKKVGPNLMDLASLSEEEISEIDLFLYMCTDNKGHVRLQQGSCLQARKRVLTRKPP